MDDEDAAERRLHELRHRYRNSLQVINSLVGLHARGIADPAAVSAFADLRSRLSMLSTIFMDLDEESEDVDLAAFLPRIAHRAANLQAGDAVCPLQIDIAPTHLEKARAAILAQILAELLMSAYRSCHDDAGARAVAVRLEDAGSGRLALTVGVGGVPIPEAETAAKKLSLAIVRSMATTLDAAFTSRDADGVAQVTFDGGPAPRA